MLKVLTHKKKQTQTWKKGITERLGMDQCTGALPLQPDSCLHLTWAPRPTGEGPGCGLACGSHSCPEGYCSNGGHCHLHPITCTPICTCPPAFTDQRCLVAGGDFQPLPNAGACLCLVEGEPQPHLPQSWDARANAVASLGRSPPEKHQAADQDTAKHHCWGSQQHRTSPEGMGSGSGTHWHAGQHGSLGYPYLRVPPSHGIPRNPVDLQGWREAVPAA